MLSSFKKFLLKDGIYFLFLSGMAFLLFHKGFQMYFHQDDFIHASFSQNFSQVVKAFNLFSKAQFPFYRPIPTQTYFFLGLKLFGFNPLPFHLFNFCLLLLNSYLLFRLGIVLKLNKFASFLAACFYTLNSTHVAPMFSAAYVHELLLTLFSLLTISSFVKLFLEKNTLGGLIKTGVFFVLALMSKETAVIVPILSLLALFLSQIKYSKKRTITVLACFASILAVYGIGHFFFYGLPSGSSYIFEIGKPTLNIFVWYLLWAMSTPTMLIDFVGPKLAINPVLWQIMRINIKLFFVFFIIFLFCLFLLFLKSKVKPKLFLLGVWLLVGVLPVLPFPKHHLAIEQSLTLVGLSFVIGILISQGWREKGFSRIISTVCLLSYLVVVFNSVEIASKTHYIANGSKLVQRIIEYLKDLPGGISEDRVLYFKDGRILVPQYGSSRQISLALGGDRAIKLLFHQPDIQVFFEDGKPLPENLRGNKSVIEIDSSELFYR